MNIKTLKEKAANFKVKAKKVYNEHSEAISVLIGGSIGAFIFGLYAGNEIKKASIENFDDGFKIGYDRGQDSVMNEMWSAAVSRGGVYSEKFVNGRDGRRVGVTVELLPDRRFK